MSTPKCPSVAANDVGNKKTKRHPAFGALKGTFTILPGVDLTEPACGEWAGLIEMKFGKDAKWGQGA